jgi:hypothetical protein
VEAAAELVPRCRTTRPGIRAKRGSIIQAYVAHPPRTRVICLDEMGPLAVKSYPGEAWQMGPNERRLSRRMSLPRIGY